MDLPFADFEVRDGSERLYPAPDTSSSTPAGMTSRWPERQLIWVCVKSGEDHPAH